MTCPVLNGILGARARAETGLLISIFFDFETLVRYISRILLAVLALRLLLGLAYSVFNPLGEAPDEADHYAYAAYIGREGSLPAGTAVTQSKHPPLYHALAAAASFWTGMDFSFLRSNPDGGVAPGQAPNFFIHTRLESWPWRGGALAMHIGRLISVLAGLALVLGTYALGRAAWPEWPAGAVAAAALAAFIPESLFVGGSMSNDMLAAALATFVLWAGLRAAGRAGAAAGWPNAGAAGKPAAGSGKPSYASALLAGAFAGLAFLTKVSTVAVFPLALAGLWLAPWPRVPKRPAGQTGGLLRELFSVQRLARPILAGAVMLAFAAPWLLRNWQLYRDPLGWPVVLGTVDRRLAPLAAADVWWMVRGWAVSFFGKFGGAGHLPLPAPLYALWFGMLALAACGWAAALLRARRGAARLPRPASPLVWPILLAAPVLTALSIISYGRVALGTDQGRLLYPALAPVSLLIVAGLAAWIPRRQAAAAAPAYGFIGLMSAVAVLALAAGIILPFAPPAQASAADMASALRVGRAFGPGLQLLALRWDPDGQDGSRALTLFWQANTALAADLRSDLRVLDAEGNLLWEWKRSPGEGRFSTDRWPAGRITADVYRVPADKLSRAAGVTLGVASFPDGAWLPPAGADGPFLALAVPGAKE